MSEQSSHSPYALLAAPALGALVGGLGGAATAPEGRMARSITRGALTGAGTTTGAGLGMLPGFALGYLTGGPVGGLGGAALGGLSGGALGNLAMRGLLGPAETDEEKMERFLKMHLEANNKEKTAMDLIQFGMKLAQSSCSYPSMPNSPTNKKHMTSASPAVLEAGEKSEEVGKPETTKTEHSEAEAKLPEEGVKSALEFGALLGGRGKQPAPAPDMTRMQRPQTPASKQPPAPKASTGLLSQTHPISAQSQTAANNAFQQFGKTWNPMDAGRGIYHQYMSGMQRDGETLGNAYGAARNFIVNNSKGPNMLNMQPPAQNVLGR